MMTAVRMEEHYTALAPKIVNLLVANGCDHAQACDIVQETFLRMWKLRDELNDETSQISGLAFTIAKNLRKDKLRKASREVLQDEIRDADGVDENSVVTHGAVPVEQDEMGSDERAILRRRLCAAFAKLPPLLREAYILFQIQELPIREIAQRTNASESLVKVRIFRAKEKLRPLLQDLL